MPTGAELSRRRTVNGSVCRVTRLSAFEALLEIQVRYLPPFEMLKGLIKPKTVKGETRADMSYAEVQTMIRTLLTVVEVDEAFYLARYPDVAQGISQGTIRSAQEHFTDHGYFEGRLPYHIDVDEAWYLKIHADVAQTIVDGEYASGQDHFSGPGYSEGRAPFALKP
jgi:hypothetical protein